jgi:Ca-activated chloride channel family protein
MKSSFVLGCVVAASLITNAFGAGLLTPVGAPASAVGMKSHQVNVVINNGFARTEVDQVFINSSSKDLEAIYSFPLPPKASLSELSLWINGVEVIGEVVPKAKARQLYDDQKAQGNDAAVAEQDGHHTFDISVYPVRANAETRVRLVYYQPLEIDLNIGRYVYPLAEGGVDEERLAFWSTDDSVHQTFGFHLILKSAFPIKDVRLPDFQTQTAITRPADGVVDVTLSTGEGGRLDKDILLYYRLDDTAPARVELIPYREPGTREGTFMLVITPGANLQPLQSGVDWTFVLDRSGSMDGGKITTLANGVSSTLGRMRTSDRFRIVTFNDQAAELTQGYTTVDAENVRNTIALVKGLQAEGSTALFDGLDLGLKSVDADRTSGLILVSDGEANVGPTKHAEFLDLLRGHDVRIFTFMMGNSSNTPLLERMAQESGGFSMNISEFDDVVGRIIQAQAKLGFQNMRDLKLRFSGEKVTAMTPARLSSVYQGRQIIAFGKYSGTGDVAVSLSAKIGDSTQTWHCNASLPAIDTLNPEIDRLWALSAIDEIMQEIREQGEDDSRKDKVVALATEYSLVTEYTSMLVLSETEREKLGIARKNGQRVERERAMQAERVSQPVQSYRTDNTPSGGMFHGSRSSGLGTGPVGPLFVLLAGLMRFVRNRKK